MRISQFSAFFDLYMKYISLIQPSMRQHFHLLHWPLSFSSTRSEPVQSPVDCQNAFYSLIIRPQFRMFFLHTCCPFQFAASGFCTVVQISKYNLPAILV